MIDWRSSPGNPHNPLQTCNTDIFERRRHNKKRNRLLRAETTTDNAMDRVGEDTGEVAGRSECFLTSERDGDNHFDIIGKKMVSPTTTQPPSVGITDLPESDILGSIFDFVGDYQYIFIASVNRQFHRVYKAKFCKTRTSLQASVASISRVGTISKPLIVTKWGSRACAVAAKAGRLDVLQWLRDPNSGDGQPCEGSVSACPWNGWTCAMAAKHGHLGILRWARANGCEWDQDTCAWAADGGHLEILQWARANGCKWNKWTCAYAALHGHLETLQWACANGCEWDKE